MALLLTHPKMVSFTLPNRRPLSIEYSRSAAPQARNGVWNELRLPISFHFSNIKQLCTMPCNYDASHAKRADPAVVEASMVERPNPPQVARPLTFGTILSRMVINLAAIARISATTERRPSFVPRWTHPSSSEHGHGVIPRWEGRREKARRRARVTKHTPVSLLIRQRSINCIHTKVAAPCSIFCCCSS